MTALATILWLSMLSPHAGLDGSTPDLGVQRSMTVTLGVDRGSTLSWQDPWRNAGPHGRAVRVGEPAPATEATEASESEEDLGKGGTQAVAPLCILPLDPHQSAASAIRLCLSQIAASPPSATPLRC